MNTSAYVHYIACPNANMAIYSNQILQSTIWQAVFSDIVNFESFRDFGIFHRQILIVSYKIHEYPENFHERRYRYAE